MGYRGGEGSVVVGGGGNLVNERMTMFLMLMKSLKMMRIMLTMMIIRDACLISIGRSYPHSGSDEYYSNWLAWYLTLVWPVLSLGQSVENIPSLSDGLLLLQLLILLSLLLLLLLLL